MNTVFNEENFPVATNHLGWNVERLTGDGWKPIFDDPCESIKDAKSLKDYAEALNPKEEFRVYEALEYPPKR
jgi:hypothetical protein